MTSLILFPVIKGFSAKNWNSSKAQDISETVEIQINMQIWEVKIQFFGIEIILCFRWVVLEAFISFHALGTDNYYNSQKLHGQFGIFSQWLLGKERDWELKIVIRFICLLVCLYAHECMHVPWYMHKDQMLSPSAMWVLGINLSHGACLAVGVFKVDSVTAFMCPPR